MAERRYDEETVIVRRGPRWRRVASFVALGLLLLMALVIAALWIERRPIATQFLSASLSGAA